VSWASDETGSHADMLVPFDRVKTDMPGDERRTEVVVVGGVAVSVAPKFLHTPGLDGIRCA